MKETYKLLKEKSEEYGINFIGNIEGRDAFFLYDTFGFPVELTVELAEEEGFTVDEDGFAKAMEEQKQKARDNQNFSANLTTGAGVFDGLDESVKSEFVGYTSITADGKIVAMADEELSDELTAGSKGSIITDVTPFYGTMGGQVGDIGVIEGANGAKTSLVGTTAPQLRTICGIVSHKGDALGLFTAVRTTELERTLQRIRRLTGMETRDASSLPSQEDTITYDSADSITSVAEGVRALGYELTEEDLAKVYEEFKQLAEKKPVGRKELDAIVAATAMQVPATYILESYVINSGNIITTTACLQLTHDDQRCEGISSGDGPIDAAFKAMEGVTGRHFELEDFRIDAVTEGKEAIGRAIVRLRNEGKLYSGSGISTDIVGAAIRAYLGALNKIVYEEKEQ